MQDVLLLSRTDLERTLDFPSVLAALSEAFIAEHGGFFDTPKRITAHTKAGGLLAMPSGGGSPEALGAKLVTIFNSNHALGMPSVSGLYVLFDPRSGVPLAVMDGTFLTLIRTAAVSALATRLLARQDARSFGVIGAGAQAGIHVRLIAAVRPIDTVVIWARQKARAEALVDSLRNRSELGSITSWIAAAEVAEAAVCDVVLTATAATQAVLPGEKLRPGAHLNSIGAHTRNTREIDTRAVTRATILAVESKDTLQEAGDFQMAEVEAGGVVRRVVTLGALLEPAARETPSRDPLAISIFKSTGVAFEDLAVAALAFRRARELGLGAGFSFHR
ncbi:MAG: ornithine cyclodeaminase family protein [Vicinamibacteria bacterium]|jgi:alanine dehydrogenase|nr:ornithine cyclodeaminase family protein [Vicinamibacteria bacterium]